jgi:hypothetical protein
LSFTDHDGYRFQAIVTDQTDPNIAVLESRHRRHGHVEDRIRDDKEGPRALRSDPRILGHVAALPFRCVGRVRAPRFSPNAAGLPGAP